MTKSEEILEILKEFKSSHSEVEACMVAKKGLEGVIMFPESFKKDVAELWEPLGSTIDEIICIISEKGQYCLDKAFFEMLGYSVSFNILCNSDTAFIVFARSTKDSDAYAYLSKISQDTAKTRQKILGIIEG